MFTDARISAALESMVQGIDSPPVPLLEIQRRIGQQQPSPEHSSHYTRVVIAAVAAITLTVITLRSISPAFVQTIEARYRAALQAMGGVAPPPAPKSLLSALSPQSTSFATAQSRVPFKIVSPVGLPKDVMSAKISTTPTGVYSKRTHSWSVGQAEVTFTYQRTGGRWFTLMAERFDPQAELPTKFIFEAKPPTSVGQPVIVKHQHFLWRNGDQVMSAVEDDGLSVPEIEKIETTMHGVPLLLGGAHTPRSGSVLKLYRLIR